MSVEKKLSELRDEVIRRALMRANKELNGGTAEEAREFVRLALAASSVAVEESSVAVEEGGEG